MCLCEGVKSARLCRCGSRPGRRGRSLMRWGGGRAVVTVALSIPRETALPRKESELAAFDRSRASTHRRVSSNSRRLGHSRGPADVESGRPLESVGLVSAKLATARSTGLLQGTDRDLQALLRCAVPSCESSCQCICPRCAAKGTVSTSLVHPDTQMRLVFGEVGWCPNPVYLTES